MGSFTQIDVDEDKYIQLKCGYDVCDHYKVGDKVDQWLDPDRPMSGKLLDGVHDADGYSHTNAAAWDRVWVVIKDGVIVEVTPRRYILGSADDYRLEISELFIKHKIKPYSVDLWSEAAWARKAKEAHFCEVHRLLNDASGVSALVTLTRSRLREHGFARRLFGPPIPRLSVVGNECSFCNNIITKDLQCHGCGHYDPPTHSHVELSANAGTT